MKLDDPQSDRLAAAAHLERLVAGGQFQAVEEVLAEYPSIGTDSEQVLELIYLEYVLRCERGEAASLAEYLQRFPQRSSDVERLFEVDQAMRKNDSQQRRMLSTPAIASLETHGRQSVAQEFVGIREDYTLLEIIGRGGMGIVYRALQHSLDRVVALKTLDSLASFNPAAVKRFHVEAQLAARLQHPNIVQIHEIETCASVPYFSMELISGGNLQEATRERPLQSHVAARLIMTLARAVEFAHRHNVVHRDLKPSNVLLAPSERADALELFPEQVGQKAVRVEPKIADFGLAQTLGSDGQNTLTTVGIGTPSFMAPEQIDTSLGKVGPASDIYSLGAILYTVLIGRPPFHAATVVETLKQVVDEEPVPLRSLQSRIAYDLETICLKCLAKEPHRRYSSASELAADLQRFLNHQPILARPIHPIERAWKWTLRYPSMAGLIGCILLAALATTWLWRRAEYSRAAEIVARKQGELLLHHRNLSLAHSEYRAHNLHRSRQLLETIPKEHRHFDWFYLKKLCNESVWETKPTDQAVVAVALSPDASLAACGHGQWGINRPQTVRVWDIANSKIKWSLEGHPPSQICDVNFSPDGKWLLSSAVSWDAQAASGGAKLWDMNDGSLVLDLPDLNSYSSSFCRDGKSILIGLTSGEIRHYECPSGKLMHRYRAHDSIVLDLVVDPLHNRFVSASREGVLCLWDIDKADEPLQRMANLRDPRRLSWHPHGNKLALGEWDGRLRTYSLVGNELIQTGFQNRDALPYINYSPDGQHLLLATFPTGARLIDAETDVTLHQFHCHDGHVRAVDFDASGRRLLTGGADGALHLWDMTDLQEIPTQATAGGAVDGMASHPERPEFAVALKRSQTKSNASPNIEIRSAKSLKLLKTLKGHSSWLTTIEYNRDGSRILSGSEDCTVRLWDAERGRQLRVLGGFEEPLVGVTFGTEANSSAAMGVDRSGLMLAYDLQSGKTIDSWRLPHRIASLASRPNSSHMAIVTEGQQTLLIDSKSRRTLATIPVQGTVTAIAFSPQGDQLAVGVEQAVTYVWPVDSLIDNASAAKPLTLIGHIASVNAISFSPDGRRLVTCSRDESMRMFELHTGSEILAFSSVKGHENQVLFTADGRHLIRAQTGGLYCWSIDSNDQAPLSVMTPQAKQSAIEFHQRASLLAARRTHLEAAAFHHSQLIDLEPDKAEHYANRSIFYMLLDRWADAKQDALKSLEPAENCGYRSYLARCCLALGEMNAYREHCQTAYQAVAAAEQPDPAEVNHLVWVASLTQPSAVDPKLLCNLLEASIGKSTNSTYLNTLALAQYRAGRFQDAMRSAAKSLKQNPYSAAPFDWIVMTLSISQLITGRTTSIQSDADWGMRWPLSMASLTKKSSLWLRQHGLRFAKAWLLEVPHPATVWYAANERHEAIARSRKYLESTHKWITRQNENLATGRDGTVNFLAISQLELPMLYRELQQLVGPLPAELRWPPLPYDR